MTIGIYAGTFDPITFGHLDIIARSFSFCDKLIVAIGVNPAKKTFFEEDERKELIKKSIREECDSPKFYIDLDKKIEVTSFQGLLVNYAKEVHASVLIRGIRSVSDFEYEINLANINKVLAPKIETVFLPTSPSMAVISSSMVKEVARYGAKIDQFVSKSVVESINNKMGLSKVEDPIIEKEIDLVKGQKVRIAGSGDSNIQVVYGYIRHIYDKNSYSIMWMTHGYGLGSAKRQDFVLVSDEEYDAAIKKNGCWRGLERRIK